MVWLQVEDALNAIIQDYEKVNHVISFFQDEKVRNIGLLSIGRREGVGLELGIGPGNFTPRILKVLKDDLVCLDFSKEMIITAKKKLKNKRLNFIRGVFEHLPLRECVISTTIMSFSLRDSRKKGRVIVDVKNSMREGGCLLIIDVGKPNNFLIEYFIAIYIRIIIPIIGGLVTGRGYNNPWSLLYKTYELLPHNHVLLHYLETHFSEVSLVEYSLGGMILLKALKK